MSETVAENCIHEDCVYRSRLSGGSKMNFCAYAIMAGHIRGCPISECDKYKPGRKKMIMKHRRIKVITEEGDE